MNPRTGRLRDTVHDSLGWASEALWIELIRDWGISHVISGKLIIQKTLNRHHLTCRSWFDQWIPRARHFFVWKMKYGKSGRKKTKSSWRNMLKSRPTTRQKGCQSWGGKVPRGRSETAGRGAAGSRGAGGREEEGGKGQIEAWRRKATQRMDRHSAVRRKDKEAHGGGRVDRAS